MPVELAPSKRVKARKEHRCDYCGKRIYVDEEHTVSKLVEGGRAYTCGMRGRSPTGNDRALALHSPAQ